MKKADLTSLEQTVARLPVDLKKYLSSQLLGQINAQADTLIATVKSYPHVPTAAMNILLNGGVPVACHGIGAGVPRAAKRSIPSRGHPWLNCIIVTNGSIICAACATA